MSKHGHISPRARHSRTFQLESLEPRQLMAGDGLGMLPGTDLEVGSDVAAAIAIETTVAAASASASTETLASATAASAELTVNASAAASVSAATATPTSISPLRNADGVFVLRPPVGSIQLPASLLKDSRVTGIVLRDSWKNVNPAPGVYNWARLDAAIKTITAAGKTFKLTIETGTSTPSWVYSQGAQAMTFRESGAFRPSGTYTMPVPWDGVMLSAYDELLREMDRHFGANPGLVMVSLGGPTQYSLEMHLPPEVRALPDFSLDKIRGAWDHVLTTYSGLFQNVRGAVQIANPFHMSDGLALQVAQDAVSILGPRASLQHNALSAQSTLERYNIYQIISQYGQAGAYTGLEEVGSSNQPRFGGSFATAWQRVLSSKARYFDVYVADQRYLQVLPPPLPSAWRNQFNPYDVNADGFETPLDALLLTNELVIGTRLLPTLSPGQLPTSYFDVDGDRFVSQLDFDVLMARLNTPPPPVAIVAPSVSAAVGGVVSTTTDVVSGTTDVVAGVVNLGGSSDVPTSNSGTQTASQQSSKSRRALDQAILSFVDNAEEQFQRFFSGRRGLGRARGLIGRLLD